MKYFALLKGLAILAVIIVVLISRFTGRKASSSFSSSPHDKESEIAKLRGLVKSARLAESRTFLEVESPFGERFWVACPEQPIEVGDTVAFEVTVPKRNYEARGLGRVLPLVYFTSHLTRESTPSPVRST